MCNGNRVSAQKLGNHDVSQETTASRMWLVLSPGLAGETQRHMACLFQLLAASPPPPSLCSLPRLLGLWSLAPRCFQFLLQHRAALPGADRPWSPSAATYVVTSVTEWAIQVLAVFSCVGSTTAQYASRSFNHCHLCFQGQQRLCPMVLGDHGKLCKIFKLWNEYLPGMTAEIS